MKRIRKSIHNLATAFATSFSANSGQYKADLLRKKFHFFVSCILHWLAFLQYLSFYHPASNSIPKREDGHISFSSRYICTPTEENCTHNYTSTEKYRYHKKLPSFKWVWNVDCFVWVCVCGFDLFDQILEAWSLIYPSCICFVLYFSVSFLKKQEHMKICTTLYRDEAMGMFDVFENIKMPKKQWVYFVHCWKNGSNSVTA